MNRWNIFALVLVAWCVGGCREVPVMAPPPPEASVLAFDAVAEHWAYSEFWRMEEALAAQQKSGRVVLNDETLRLTILELTPDREARSNAVAARSRCEVAAAGVEFLTRSVRAEEFRSMAKAGSADSPEMTFLRPLYLVNHRAKLAAALRLRRAAGMTSQEELTEQSLAAWPESIPLPEDFTLAELQRHALLRRAELTGYAGVLPALTAELARIPYGAGFPLKRFAALPAALAEKRAASPDFDWQFAAALAAAVGVSEEVAENYAAWSNWDAAMLRAEADFQQSQSAVDRFRQKEALLKKEIARIGLAAAAGFPDEHPEAEPALRKPTPAEQLAAAWVIDFLLQEEL